MAFKILHWPRGLGPMTLSSQVGSRDFMTQIVKIKVQEYVAGFGSDFIVRV